MWGGGGMWDRQGLVTLVPLNWYKQEIGSIWISTFYNWGWWWSSFIIDEIENNKYFVLNQTLWHRMLVSPPLPSPLVITIMVSARLSPSIWGEDGDRNVIFSPQPPSPYYSVLISDWCHTSCVASGGNGLPPVPADICIFDLDFTTEK